MRRRALLRAAGVGAGALALPVGRSAATGASTGIERASTWSPLDYDDAWSDVADISRILHDVYVHGDYAYCAYWDAGAWIVDVSEPTSPAYVARVGDFTRAELADLRSDEAALRSEYGEAPGNAHYVAVDETGTLLGVGAEAWDDPDTDGGGPGGIDLYDVGDKASPQKRSTIDPPSASDETIGGTWVTSHNFDLAGDRLYSSWYDGGVRVYDVADPANPELLSWWRKPDEARFWTAQIAKPGDFFVASSYARGGHTPGLYTFPDRPGRQADPPGEITGPEPDAEAGYEPLGDVRIPGAAEAVVGQDGETVYVAASDGFVVVDVSDPSDPTVVAERRGLMADHSLGPLTSVLDVKVDGDRLLVPGPAQRGALKGFLLYDVSDPADPTQVGEFYEVDHSIHNSFLLDGYAYLTSNAGRRNALQVIDVTDATTTTPTTSTPTSTSTPATSTPTPTTTPSTTTPPTTTTAGGGDGTTTGGETTTDDGSNGQGLPGFGLGAAVVGLGLGAYRYLTREEQK